MENDQIEEIVDWFERGFNTRNGLILKLVLKFKEKFGMMSLNGE